MRTTFVATAAGLTAATAAAAQPAQPAVPAFENFENGLGGFAGGGGLVAEAVTEDQNTFARVVRTLPDPGGGGVSGATTTLANTNAGNPFAGNYIAGGIDVFSFDVRHDAPVPVDFSLRLATPFNFPGVNFVTPQDFAVPAGDVFTTLTFALDPDSPLTIDEAGDAAATLMNIQNIQLAVDNPEVLIEDEVTFDFDNVRSLPTPGAAGLLCVAGVAAARRRR